MFGGVWMFCTYASSDYTEVQSLKMKSFTRSICKNLSLKLKENCRKIWLCFRLKTFGSSIVFPVEFQDYSHQFAFTFYTLVLSNKMSFFWSKWCTVTSSLINGKLFVSYRGGTRICLMERPSSLMIRGGHASNTKPWLSWQLPRRMANQQFWCTFCAWNIWFLLKEIWKCVVL